LATSLTIEFNAPRDVERAQSDSRFDSVLHVFAKDWHGIRAATSCLPGLKVGIPHDKLLPGLDLHTIESVLTTHRVANVIYQGYSRAAHELARILYMDFGPRLNQFVVTHVSPAQFEHTFELQMLGLMREHLRKGVFKRVASVKPRFSDSVDFIDRETIFNCGPRATQRPTLPGCSDYVFVPLENTWRKNLYVNVLGGMASRASRVLCVNQPSYLQLVSDIDRVEVIGWHPAASLLEIMRSAACVLNVTMTECQPMTQLESLSVGTPCLTGPLRIPALASHELTRLSEVGVLDDPLVLGRAIDRVLDLRQRDEDGLQEMIRDFLALRLRLCTASYVNLLS
jgi:hypothetical protein